MVGGKNKTAPQKGQYRFFAIVVQNFAYINTKSLGIMRYFCGMKKSFSLSASVPTETVRKATRGKVRQSGEDVLIVENIRYIKAEPLPIHEIKGYILAILCHAGHSEVNIDFKPFRLSANQLLILLPGQKISTQSVCKNFKATHFFMSEKFISSLEIGDDYSFHESVKRVPIVTLSARMKRAMINYRDMACSIIDNVPHSPHTQESLRLLTKLYFLNLGRMIYPRKDKTEHDPTSLITRFRNLVECCFREHRDVAYYAAELCLTPKYLTTYIKRCCGCSASAVIDKHVILEAKTLLSSTKMSVQQIANELNFPTQTMFSRYFKRHTGLTATQYRATVGGKG